MDEDNELMELLNKFFSLPEEIKELYYKHSIVIFKKSKRKSKGHRMAAMITFNELRRKR